LTDFASLVLAVDSTQVKAGAASLDGLTAAGARAEAATIGLGKGTRSAATEAAALAASAQAAARAAVGQATGFTAVTNAVHGNTIAMRESLVVGRELLSGNLTRLPGSLSILAQQFAISGKGASAFASQILQSFGIIKSVTDAELASEAAAAAVAANAIRSVAARAVANVTAADTEVALARAAIATATTTEALAAAQVELAVAHEAVAAAAAEATVAEVALAEAATAEATAASAAAAATTTALAPIGVILAGIAVAAGIAFGAFKLLQSDLQPDIDKFVAGLGLTKKEVEDLKDTSITFGDVMKGVWKTIADHTIADEGLRSFKSFAINQFVLLLKAGVDVFAELYGDIVGTYRAVKDVWTQFPAAFGDIFYSGVNLAINAINGLVQKGLSLLNSFVDEANKLPFVNIAHAAVAPIEALRNQYAGAAGKMISDVRGEIAKATSEAKSAANSIVDETINNILGAAEDRIGAKADHAAAKAKKAKEEVDHLAKALDQLQHLLFLFDNAKVEIDQGSLFSSEGPSLDKMFGKLPDFGAQILDALRAITDQAVVTGQALSDAFGKPGDALGQLLVNIQAYGAEQERLAQAVADNSITQATADQQLAAIRAHNTMAALEGIKSLFSQHSQAYKVMSAVEKAYAAFQAAQTIAAIARDLTHTASSVANSATRAAADEAAGASKIFSQLGVWAFPVVAAMVALLATFGLHKGGGGSGQAPTSAEDLQKAAGAGTVLGDPTAKSASIANSLEIMAKNSTKGLDYSQDMVRALRGIQSGIGNLAASIGRMFQAGGAFDTSTFGLGTKSSGIQGLFGSKTTTSLYDQGITLNASTVGQIIQQGITGATYNVLEIVKKNSGFLGIGGSTKTSYSTSYGSLDPAISSQVQLIIGDLYKTVVSAAKVLGLDVGAALQQFQVEIGKISFKDLTGQQITDQLNAVFSKIGDQMAGFAVAGLANFQKAGEGLFETLNRLAKDYLTIDAALKSIGKTFGSVGTASIAAREKLIDLAGGLDQFVEQINFFYDHFLTDAQKTAFLQSQVSATFQGLGIAIPSSIAAFAKLVTGANLTTDAGQQLFETLMQIAPAFYQLQTAAEQAAAALAKQKQQLQLQLLQAQGKAVEALALQRQMELAAMDASLRPLQQQIYAAQDLAKAKDNLAQAYKNESAALQQTADKFHGFADSLRSFRDGLFTGAGGSTSYNGSLVQLMKQAGLAAGGNEAALGGGLQSSAQQFLDVATANARSLQDVQRAKALVARYLDQAIGGAESQASIAEQQLDRMKDQVGKLVDIDDHVLTVADAIKTLTALMFPGSGGTSAGGSTGGTHAPGGGHTAKQQRTLEAIHEKLSDVHTAIEAVAVSSGKTSRVLDRSHDGTALRIITDSDSPIQAQVV
jgi:hypothetical protein